MMSKHRILTAEQLTENAQPKSHRASKSSLDGQRLSFSRREVLGVGGALLLGSGIAAGFTHFSRSERGRRARVFVAKVPSYEVDLTICMRDGLKALGVGPSDIAGKSILLKPNLVETAVESPHINTSPNVVVAAAEVFRSLGARKVIVAEGQGHRRDSQLVLEESGMADALRDGRIPFVDLNHDEVVPVEDAGEWTSLGRLYLPKTLLAADWIVSMPKLKTHHWTGVTCSMKNLFGVMPGIVYGWPKNVLHLHGIDECILDINTTVPSSLSIVDGIIGMEGDGPIMGTPKHSGCVIMGRNATAVDATATRVMGLNPYGIKYLTLASGRLGPIHERNISQIGDPIEAVESRYRVIDAPHLANLVNA